MSKTEIIALTAVFIFAGFRIYQKYFQKAKQNQKNESRKESGSIPTTNSDDYEPYSGKN
ncbi:MAG: hypothetical protein IPN68_08430 [Bacteroidetes bacterium]|nr:hypothetical protein [Bacteroidota bacterium]